MNAQAFKARFLAVIEQDFPAFEKNHVLDDSSTFCDWVDTFIAWMEFSSQEECEDAYYEPSDTEFYC